jgi:hypothetical protein
MEFELTEKNWNRIVVTMRCTLFVVVGAFLGIVKNT